jgi:hypothetical protein
VIAAFYEGDLTEEEFSNYMLEKANELKEKWSPAMEAARNNVKTRQSTIKILGALTGGYAGNPYCYAVQEPLGRLVEGVEDNLNVSNSFNVQASQLVAVPLKAGIHKNVPDSVEC